MKTVLIVDDVTMMRTIVKNVVSGLLCPCECLEAEDGLQALRYLALCKIDLVLLDWQMPNLTGIEFLRKARALKLDIPIIMVTGESGPRSVQAAMRAGITDYIVKPVTKEILREKLSKLSLLEGTNK